jgi:hypothetical protein
LAIEKAVAFEGAPEMFSVIGSLPFLTIFAETPSLPIKTTSARPVTVTADSDFFIKTF